MRAIAPDALIVADTVTAVAAIELKMDYWDIDACCAASQKAFMLPPGLAFTALGPRARARLKETTPVAPASLDLRWRLDAYEKGTVANTPPVSLWFGLEKAMEIILIEGLETRWKKVQTIAEHARHELTTLGFRPVAENPVNSVTAAYYPSGTDDTLRDRCANLGVTLAGGQDQLTGKILRLSHMGAVDMHMTTQALQSIRTALPTN